MDRGKRINKQDVSMSLNLVFKNYISFTGIAVGIDVEVHTYIEGTYVSRRVKLSII